MRDTKHLGKHASKLAETAKEKALFRTQRKPVEAGAHGTLDYTWIALVTIGLIVNPNRIIHLSALAVFWVSSFAIFYLPRWKKR